MKIVFMGTPDFSVPCLKALIESRHTVAMVVSQPDKPVGRKQIVEPTPVKALALKHDIKVYQPSKLRVDGVEDELRAVGADVFVVVAYGKILPKNILDIPPFGCVNIHGSLLPKYRGAAPIQRAVMNGEAVTGVCSMYMNEGMDTGDIISSLEMNIGENDTSGEVFEKLSQIGANCLLYTLDKIDSGTAERIEQNNELATYAPMLSKEESVLDIKLPARQLHNHIRGMNPWPVARFRLSSGSMLQVISSRCIGGSGSFGEVLSVNPLTVACGEGALELLEVKPEGKQKMPGDAFARGMRISIGDIIFE